MTIFIAGIHGTGKTYLCQSYASNNEITHKSSSDIIRGEKLNTNWSKDKRTESLDENQIALRDGVKKIIATGSKLLLDGHFTLINSRAEITPLHHETFRNLGISAVILIEANEGTISKRIQERDSERPAVNIKDFTNTERDHAKHVCKLLSLPLKILHEPTKEEFFEAVNEIIKNQENKNGINP